MAEVLILDSEALGALANARSRSAAALVALAIIATHDPDDVARLAAKESGVRILAIGTPPAAAVPPEDRRTARLTAGSADIMMPRCEPP